MVEYYAAVNRSEARAQATTGRDLDELLLEGFLALGSQGA